MLLPDGVLRALLRFSIQITPRGAHFASQVSGELKEPITLDPLRIIGGLSQDGVGYFVSQRTLRSRNWMVETHNVQKDNGYLYTTTFLFYVVDGALKFRSQRQQKHDLHWARCPTRCSAAPMPARSSVVTRSRAAKRMLRKFFKAGPAETVQYDVLPDIGSRCWCIS